MTRYIPVVIDGIGDTAIGDEGSVFIKGYGW